MSAFAALLRRDLRLAVRNGGDALMVVAFFIVAGVLFPFGVGAEPAVLARIAPGLVWVMALLSVLLSLDRLFQSDYEDGSLDQILLSPQPLVLAVAAKIAAHWLVTAVPLMIATPLLALLLSLDPALLPPLLLGMLLGTPTLAILGAIGAALALGARRGGVLLSLLVLPLYIPVLVFGAGAVGAAASGEPFQAPLMALGAFLLAALALGPWAAAASLRQAAQ